MKYLKVNWLHSFPNEPILLYSELDEGRWETRKVEIFADGRTGFADPMEATVSTRTLLSEKPIPTLTEIESDIQFQPVEITQAEFEKVWNARKSLGL